MESFNKIVQRQDAHFKLSKSTSNETSINLSRDISDYISKESGEVNFTLHREDFIRAIGVICNILPLYNRDNIADSSVIVFESLYGEVSSYFDHNDTVKYKVQHLKREDNRFYLNNLSVQGFNLRHFLVERHSILLFGEKSETSIDLRLKTTTQFVDEELLLGDNSIETVREKFINYLKLTNYHMGSHEDYVSKFETELNAILSRNLGREVSIFNYIDIDNLKYILSEIQQIDEDLASIMGDYQGTKYAPFTVLKQYFTFLEVLKDCKAILESQNNTFFHYKDIKCEQIIYYGAPGTGKSFKVENRPDETEDDRIRTTFHPDTDYSSFVGCYKPQQDKDDPKKIIYKFEGQCFAKAYVEAWKRLLEETPRNYTLVIEEINRGNCAQIFGDIFQLLDRKDDGFSQYDIQPDEDLAAYLRDEFTGTTFPVKYAKIADGSKMVLPPNLSIIATMNTSDQSLFPIDSAFKRRWDWEYIPIQYKPKNEQGHTIANKIDIDGSIYDWGMFIKEVNDRIYNLTKSEDKQLGYFFVRPSKGENITMQRFVSKVIFYLWSDIYKDYAGRDNSIFKFSEDDDENNKKDHSFNSFFDNGVIQVNLVKKFIEQFVKTESIVNDIKLLINGKDAKISLNGTWGGRSVAEALSLLTNEQLETLFISEYNQNPILNGRCKLIEKQPMPAEDPIEPSIKSYADYRSMQWQVGETGFYVQTYITANRKAYIEKFAEILGNDVIKIIE